MGEKTLHVMVGLPRSGKSTKAREMGHPIVNPDAVRLAMHGQAFIDATEKMVWAVTHYMVRALFEAGHTDVILDATNTTPNRRGEWVSSQWITRFLVLPTDRETCLQRAELNERADLIPVIERMADRYVAITKEEMGEHAQKGGPCTHSVSHGEDWDWNGCEMWEVQHAR